MKMRWFLVLLVLPVVGCVPAGSGDASNPNTPGATGRTVILGNNSTISGDAEATHWQKLWGEMGTSN